jgi:putative NADH-flavin reductase
VGRLVLEQALVAGHVLTVVVRDPSRLNAPVRVVQADFSSATSSTLEPAVAGADLVLSCLGARTAADATAGVAWKGTRALVEAMGKVGARRVVAISAAPVSTTPSPDRPSPPDDPGDDFVGRLLNPIVKRVFRHQYDDLARMEDVLRGSALDWTVVRPPRLLDGPARPYRTALGQNVRGGRSVRRVNVARLMLALTDRSETFRQPVGVAD